MVTIDPYDLAACLLAGLVLMIVFAVLFIPDHRDEDD